MDQLATLAAHAQVIGDYDWAGELPDFNFYCPPQTLRIWFAPDQHLDLILHTIDVIRQLPIERGLTATPRNFNGDIEIPADTFAALDALRSEEHTSELQSLMRKSYDVFCLQKKKRKKAYNHTLT